MRIPAFVVLLTLLPLGAQAAPAGSSRLSCLSELVCDVKERVKFRRKPWKPAFCRLVAEEALRGERLHGVQAPLTLATMLNESEFVADAMRASYHKDRTLKALDGGLMGLRCIVGKKHDRRGRFLCSNGSLAGMTVDQMMDPRTNIRIGVARLAHWKNGAAKVTQTVKYWHRGRRRVRLEVAPCPHANHAWWAHYNHGKAYYREGRSRHYPHRVAVLYKAFVDALETQLPAELLGPITVRDKRKRPRTIDRPVGRRQKRLVAQILKSQGSCRAVARRSPSAALASIH